jgi:hypothetical protein
MESAHKLWRKNVKEIPVRTTTEKEVMKREGQSAKLLAVFALHSNHDQMWY